MEDWSETRNALREIRKSESSSKIWRMALGAAAIVFLGISVVFVTGGFAKVVYITEIDGQKLSLSDDEETLLKLRMYSRFSRCTDGFRSKNSIADQCIEAFNLRPDIIYSNLAMDCTISATQNKRLASAVMSLSDNLAELSSRISCDPVNISGIFPYYVFKNHIEDGLLYKKRISQYSSTEVALWMITGSGPSEMSLALIEEDGGALIAKYGATNWLTYWRPSGTARQRCPTETEQIQQSGEFRTDEARTAYYRTLSDQGC